jgi:hypothetical protein
MITADTITDEQIDALRAEAYGYDDDLKTVRLCFVAIGEDNAMGRAARARCAEILNARKAGAK